MPDSTTESAAPNPDNLDVVDENDQQKDTQKTQPKRQNFSARRAGFYRPSTKPADSSAKLSASTRARDKAGLAMQAGKAVSGSTAEKAKFATKLVKGKSKNKMLIWLFAGSTGLIFLLFGGLILVVFLFLGNPDFSGGGVIGNDCYVGGLAADSNLGTGWNFFISKNFTNEQSAGILGNLIAESQVGGDGDIHPDNIQDSSKLPDGYYDPTAIPVSAGYGIAQWTSTGRKLVFKGYADGTGQSYDSLVMQLELIWFEMTGQPSVAGVFGGGEQKAYLALSQTDTVKLAAETFARRYERNAASAAYEDGLITYNQAFGARIAHAEEVFAAYASGSGQSSGCVPVIVEGDTTDIPCDPHSLNDKLADGYKDGKLYKIRICNIPLYDGSSGPVVNSQISTAVYEMIQAAGRGAVGVPLSGGGFRTMQDQIDARIRNDCPDIYDSPASSCRIPTARPGYSNHQMGFAIDFHHIDMCPTTTLIDGRKFCQDPSSVYWVWLTGNAGGYGLQQLRTEAWHWSIDGR